MSKDKDTGSLDIPFGEAPERILINTAKISDNVDSSEDLVAVKTLTGMPRGWLELIQAIALLSKHATDDTSPFLCEHDTLYVMADEGKFTNDEVEQLATWGFHPSPEGGFYSFRYGSA
jgi:hypothetical protein